MKELVEKKFFVTLIFIIGLLSFTRAESGIVDTENGKIRGDLRDYFYAFEGVPYAEPPIGENRFAEPKPLKEKWESVREFKKYGASCMQWDHFKPPEDKVWGDEDCLFLNVYVPKSVLSSNKKVPVFFFIHGGAFMFGGSDFYQPKHFMKKDVVLITINYRLGPMGFLTTEDDVLPGNLGLKDQVMALKWVNKNIHNFNGDKNSVTIIGYSAGGASVHLHYMSPLSKGLFKNGISFSGCALNPWVIMENAQEKTHIVANIVNCPINDHVEMLKCLRKVPAKAIVATMQLFQPFLYNPFSPLGVVVEKNSKSAFLTEFPSVLLEKQKINKSPWLVSAAQSEGLYPVAEFFNDDILQQIDKEWDLLAPHLLDFDGVFTNSSRKLEIAKEIRKQYFEDEDSCHKISKPYFSGLTDVFSDRLYKNGIRHAIELQSKFSPTYFYYFNFKQLSALGELMTGHPETNLGVSHGEDVLLIFDSLARGEFPELTEEEAEMSSHLLDLMINFSLHNEIKFNGIKLNPIKSASPEMLNIRNLETSGVEPMNDFGNKKFWDPLINFKNEN